MTKEKEDKPHWMQYVLGFVLFAFLFGYCSDDPDKTTTSKDMPAIFSGWDGSVRELKEEVKSRMNDPSSFEHVETTYSENGLDYNVFMTYRGKNAFGGTLTKRVRALVSSQGKVITITNLD